MKRSVNRRTNAGNRVVSEAGTSLLLPNLRSRYHQTIATLTDATVVEEIRARASPEKGHQGRDGFLEEALSKLKSNGQVEARWQEQCVYRPGGKKECAEL